MQSSDTVNRLLRVSTLRFTQRSALLFMVSCRVFIQLIYLFKSTRALKLVHNLQVCLRLVLACPVPVKVRNLLSLLPIVVVPCCYCVTCR